MLRLIALFDRPVRAVVPSLGRKHVASNAKARKVLGWEPRPAKTAVIACAESLIAKGAGG